MGTLIEYETRGTLDWCFGGDLYDKKGCLRLLSNPKAGGGGEHGPVPQTYKGPRYMMLTELECIALRDHCHNNASVLTFWFYLLAQGGKGNVERFPNESSEPYEVQGIGITDASTIVMDTMFLLPPEPKFADVRRVSLERAELRFGKGSKQYIATFNASHAVGLGPKYEGDRTCTPGTGSAKVEPWPTTLQCNFFPNEIEWQIDVSPSFNFDKDVKTSIQTSLNKNTAVVTAHFNLEAKTPYFWRIRAKKTAQEAEGSVSERAVSEGSTVLSRSDEPKARRGLFEKAKSFIEIFKGSSETLVLPQKAAEKEWGDWSPTYFFTTASKAPNPAAPWSGSKIHPWGAEFSWSPVPSAKGYEVDVSGEPQKPVTEPKAVFSLKKGSSYKWRVRAVGPDNIKGDWSYPDSGVPFETTVPKAATGMWPAPAEPSTLFSEDKGGYCWTVAGIGPKGDEGIESDPACYSIAPPRPVMISPAPGAYNVPYDPATFTWTNPWEKEYPVDNYWIKIDSGSYNYKYEFYAVKGTQHTVPLAPFQSYGWHIYAQDLKTGLATISGPTPNYFSTKAAPPPPKPPPQQPPPQQPPQQQAASVSAPSLICPLGYWANGGFGDYFMAVPSYKFKWSKVPGATNYLLTVYTAANSPPYAVQNQYFQQEYGDVGESPPIAHPPQTVYRWQIQARKGNGPWSAPALSEYYTPVYGPLHPKAVLIKCYP